MHQPADIVLKNAKVFTLNQRQPWAQALAIHGNQIVAVGSDSDIQSWTDPQTKILSLEGRPVLPGFNDAHTHYIGAALDDACTFSLYGVTTLQEAGEIVATFARQNPGLTWLHGVRLDLGRFENGQFPNRAMLDQFEQQRPVAISDIDGHTCWVNSKALELLGYTASTPDPVGGQIVKDSRGEPTGLLLEAASETIPDPVLPPGMDFKQVMLDAGDRLNRLGITSLSNNGISLEHLEILIEMAAEGSLAFRMSEWLELSADLETASHLRERLKTNEFVRVIALKTFIDGVISSRTAWMLEPYSDDPGNTGFPMMDVEEMTQWVIQADAAGFQVITHAIGDRAVRETLNMYERAMQKNGRHNSRHRIEHIELAHPADQPRFAQLGVIPSMQPLHCTACIEDYMIDRIGKERGAYSYIWRSFVESGAHLCFSTDWPAVDLRKPNPLENIFGAVTRTLPHRYGKMDWFYTQHLPLEQAIHCYTLAGAYAEFMEKRKGSIEVGKLADLCVLDRDIFSPDPMALLESKPAMTMVDGRITFRDF